MRPVTVRSVITLPCTLLLSSHASIQDSTITALFCSKKYLANLSAVTFKLGSLIVFNTASLIIILFLSVNCFGFQPLFINLSAICCLEPILKGISFVFVFISTIVGSNSSKDHCSKSYISSFNFANNSCAFFISKAKPFFSCWSSFNLISCSKSMDSLEKPLLSFNNSL